MFLALKKKKPHTCLKHTLLKEAISYFDVEISLKWFTQILYTNIPQCVISPFSEYFFFQFTHT